MQIFMSALPIFLVLIGFVVLKLGGRIVAPAGLVITFLLGWLYFKTDVSVLAAKGWAGLVSGAKLMYMLWSALIIVKILDGTGALIKIRKMMSNLTDDKRKLVILISWGFGSFIEGVSAAGSPGVICIPLLVGLGVDPMSAIVATLVCNGIPTSWGGVGLSTSGGFGAITADVYPWAAGVDVLNSVSISAGRISFVGALLMPFIIVALCFGFKAIKGVVKECLAAGISAAAAMLFVTQCIGFEFTDIAYGLFSMLCTAIVIAADRRKKLPTPAEYKVEVHELADSDMPAWKAVLMYALVVVFLPIARLTLPGTWLYQQGFAVWIGTTLLVVDVIGLLVFRSVKEAPKYMLQAVKGIVNAAISICCLLALSEIMKAAGMLSILAKAAAALGAIYPAIAVAIGMMGSFMTGSGLGSNSLFHGLHIEAVEMLGCNMYGTLGAQSVGGALGNMICANNVCAAEAAAEMANQEGLIMRKTLKAGLFLLVIYMVVALLNVYVLYPAYAGVPG